MLLSCVLDDGYPESFLRSRDARTTEVHGLLYRTFDGVAVLGAASKTHTFVFARRHRFKVSDYTHCQVSFPLGAH